MNSELQFKLNPKDIIDLGKQNIIPIILGFLGIILLVGGIFQAYLSKSSQSNLVFEESKSQQENVQLIIDVAGAVMNPGVYKLTSESRMVDALAAAGGLSSEADRDYVEKNINLAGKLTDGLKIYIPRVGEDILIESQVKQRKTDESNGGQVININLASSSDLELLPGIGEVTAQKIIDARPYSSVEELKSKNVVGDVTFEKIKNQIAAN